MLNTITIMGRLVRDPELRRTGNGTAVTSFTVAVERDFASKDVGKKEVDFLDCVAWKSTGEFVGKYFKKGSLIVVNGRLQMQTYTDKNGNNRKAAEIVANNVYFGSSKKEEPNPSGNDAAYGYPTLGIQDPYSEISNGYPYIDSRDNDLPF